MYLCALPHSFSHPCELGAHFLGLFDHASLQHVLGTLGVDESVGGVQSLGLIHPLSSLSDVPSMLPEDEGQYNSHDNRMATLHSQFKQSTLVQMSGVCYLVNLGFDKEEFDECGRTLDGCVDVF